MWYPILKWLHVISAITAVGANITYSVWIMRASRQPATLPFVLSSISFIDRRLANPAYAVLLATGLGMALTVRIPLTTPWLLSSLILYALTALMGILAYAPVARRQRTILEQEGFSSPAYRRAERSSSLLGTMVTIDVLIIVFLMVVKPPLWN